MSRAVMQQALDALEQYKGVVVTHRDPESFRRMEVDGGQAARDAIAALKQALAEPEQKVWCACGDSIEPDSGAKCGNCVAGDGAALAEPGSDYERGFVDGMSEQAKRSVDKAVNRMAEPEHEVKDLSNYEFKTYKIGGFQLEAGFYSADELRDLIKAFDKMNAAAERSMRRMK